MKKKVLFLLASLALVTTLAVNGTFAQELLNLAENVIAIFIPVAGNSPTQGDEQTFQIEVCSSGDRILAPSHYSDESFPGFDEKKVSGIVTNTTYTKNKTSKAAYVRICIYVKDDPNHRLRHSAPVAEKVNDFTSAAKVDGNGYTLYNFDYLNTLAGNDKTSNILMKVALTKETTNEDLTNLGEDFIKVQTFAIAAESFQNIDKDGTGVTDSTTKASPHEALTLALGPIDSFNPFN